MKTIYRCLNVLAVFVACAAASAQNLDPTVVVDRAYEGKLVEVHKPALEMSVPDTVMRFELDFDYSVFDNPFKGSYEFNPYLLSMKPSVATDKAGIFYLRAGAGYQLRPELDLIWSPKMKNDAFRLDVYAHHRSFFGDYYLMNAAEDPHVDLIKVIDDVYMSAKGGFMSSKAGVNLGYDWEKSALDFNAGYYGVQRFMSGDAARNYNAFDADFTIKTRDGMDDMGLTYLLNASYRLAADNSIGTFENKYRLNENNIEVNAAIGTSREGSNDFALDLHVDHDGYTGFKEGSASIVSVTPHYIYDKGILHADLGLKIAKIMADETSGLFIFNAKDQIVYPDVKVRVDLIRDALSLFAKVGGGSRIYSNADLLERNIFLSLPEYGRDDLRLNFGSDMGIGVERISARAGFEGRFGSKFSWNIHTGYSDHASAIVDAANPYVYLSGVDYAAYSAWDSSFEWSWKSDRFSADGLVTYCNAWGDAFSAESSSDNFKPAAFTGDVSFEYNYNRRIYAGVDCAFSSERVSERGRFVMPGYADLGVSAEYVTSRAISFWVRGGNLLGMTIQRNPIYAVKGPYFTLGICLKL